MLSRVHLGNDAFDRQRIELAGYLLIVAREGSVILDGAENSLLLQEGDAALIPPGRFKLTEIPRPRFTRGQTVYYFFNERALADLAARRGIDEIAARVSLPALPFYPVQRLGATLDAAAAMGSLKLTNFSAVFTGLINARPAIVFTFLKHQLFVPRFRLCLFLEDHCRGKMDLKQIAPMYPNGATAFRRDCMNYLDRPVEQWLFRRRIELAQQWLRHTDRHEHEVAAQLGYTNMRRFRGDMKRFGRFSPLELRTLRLLHPQELTSQNQIPFWFPDGEARAAKQRRSACDVITIGTSAPKPSVQRALLKKYSDERCQSAPARDEVFLTNNPSVQTGTDRLIEPQAAKIDNIIDLELVERWQFGGASLRLEPELVRMAA